MELMMIKKYATSLTTCKIPFNDDNLKDLILLLQQHSHSGYCRKRGSCRFHFPKPPSHYTLIASKLNCDESSMGHKKAELVLEKGYKFVEQNSILYSSQGANVILKRQPLESRINPYNIHSKAWQALLMPMPAQCILLPT